MFHKKGNYIKRLRSTELSPPSINSTEWKFCYIFGYKKCYFTDGARSLNFWVTIVSTCYDIKWYLEELTSFKKIENPLKFWSNWFVNKKNSNKWILMRSAQYSKEIFTSPHIRAWAMGTNSFRHYMPCLQY